MRIKTPRVENWVWLGCAHAHKNTTSREVGVVMMCACAFHIITRMNFYTRAEDQKPVYNLEWPNRGDRIKHRRIHTNQKKNMRQS